MNDRAVTETIGVILLVAVVVVASVTLGTGILVQTSSVQEQSENARLNIKTELTESSVTVRHVGGPSFETDDVLFRLKGDSGRVGAFTLAEIAGGGVDGTYDDRRASDQTFDVGDEATLNHSFSGYIDVALFDAESGDRLYHTLRSATSGESGPTGSPPTAAASSLDRVGEGFEITLDGSDSTDADGAIESYSWSVVSGTGTIVEDDTATPNATYNAPADVSGNQSVTIELTVTDSDGLTDTTTITVTVVDVDTAQAPGDGSAFDDPNGNGVYDPGETVISKETLEDGFNDTTVDLVIYPSVGEVTSSGNNNPVDISANTITAGNDFRANGGTVRLTATGDVRIDGATLDANSNEGIVITSVAGRIFANETTMTANKGDIALNSNGDIYLESAALDAGGYTADLGVSTATLYVDQLSLGKGNSGGTLIYDPDDITVNGTPSRGVVVP